MAKLSDSQDTYRYQPLDLSKHQIRLIALHPASTPDEKIACRLEVFDAETAPYYIALSYTWGHPAPTRFIRLDDQAFEIRQNLYAFLESYRNDTSNIHYIWIDQICISQAHAGERNHQVQQMSHIYTHCLYTIIWLGRESQDTALSFVASPTQRLACTLLRNEYFNRLWVIQEVFLSPKARVLCGTVWLQIVSLTTALQGMEEGLDKILPLEFIDFMLLDERAFAHLGPMPLEGCLTKYATHECQDPRDKVYGLLSLIENAQRVVVDYSKSTLEVFLDVALVLLKTSWRDDMTSRSDWDTAHERSSHDWLMMLSRQMGLHEHGLSLSNLLHLLGNVDARYVDALGIREGHYVLYGKDQWWDISLFRHRIYPWDYRIE